MKSSNVITFSERVFRLIFVIIFIIMGGSFAFSVISFFDDHQNHRASFKQQVISQTSDAANLIFAELNEVSELIDKIALDMGINSHSKKEALEYIEKEYKNNSVLKSLAVTYKANFLNSDEVYFSPYFERLINAKENPKNPQMLKGYDDKTNSDVDWFNLALEGGALWTEPYYEKENDVLMTTYSVPFYQSKKDYEAKEKPIGVIPSDINLEELNNLIKHFQLGKTGYAILLSKENKVMTHPVFEYAREKLDFQELKKKPYMDFIEQAHQCFASYDSATYINVNNADGSNTHLGCMLIKETGWKLLTVYSDYEGSLPPEKIKDYILLIVTSFIFMLLSGYSIKEKSYVLSKFSVTQCWAYTIIFVFSINLVPRPPARITTFIFLKLFYTSKLYMGSFHFQKPFLAECQYPQNLIFQLPQKYI